MNDERLPWTANFWDQELLFYFYLGAADFCQAYNIQHTEIKLPLPSVLLTAPQPACMAALHWPNGFGVRQRKLAHGLTVATTVPITKRNWMRTGNAECYQKAIPNMAVFWSCFDPRKRRNPYLSIELGGGSGKVFSTKKRSGLRPF